MVDDSPVDKDVIELVALDRPVDVDDDNDVTLLVVDDSPVDKDVIELVTLDRPVDVDDDNDVTLLVVDDRPVDVDDDSDVTLLVVDDSPVDKDVIELVALNRPVEVEVDKLLIAVFVAYSCEPLITSVLVAVTRPAATFVIWRSAPGAPTLTTLDGVVPA